MQIGTFRCHDGDDNENVKQATGGTGRTTILHLHHTFLYIPLPSLHDYDGKMPNFPFMEDVNKRRLNFLSLSELEYGQS